MVSLLTLLNSVILLVTISYTSPTETGVGICQCAVFKNKPEALKFTPLVYKNTEVDMPNDAEGDAECKELCIALAVAARPNAPKVLCNAAKHDKDDTDFMITVYYRLIQNGEWLKTEMTSIKPYCCKNGLPCTLKD